MTRHSIDDYGHTTQTAPIVDEWGTQHLPLTSVALAAAVPVIEAELRARIAAEIEAERAIDLGPAMTADAAGYDAGRADAFDVAARIARGQK